VRREAGHPCRSGCVGILRSLRSLSLLSLSLLVGCKSVPDRMGTLNLCGSVVRADGVFFVVDKSGSMSHPGGLDLAKKTILDVLASLPASGQFGLVCFDQSSWYFPPKKSPAPATAEMRAAAAQFLDRLHCGGGSCVKQALLMALEMARDSTARQKAIVYIGDGGGTCYGQDELTYLQDTLESITCDNAGTARVYAMCVLDPHPIHEEFLQTLAARNGGEYCRMKR